MGSATGLGLFFILHCSGVVLAQGQTRPPYLVPYSLDCRLTKSGHEYAGPLNTTRSGKNCQAWNSDQPHFNYYKDNTNYPEGNSSAAGNRCRNPDSGYDGGVWCHTTNNRVRWELCDVRLCECLSPSDPLGVQYQGQTNRTGRGQSCRLWRLQYPNRHPFNESVFFPDSSISEVSNYCRNPNSSRPNGPWCYVNANLDWDYCNIPTCNQSSVILRTTRSPLTTSALTSTRVSSTSRTSIASTKTSSTTPTSTMSTSISTSYWITTFPTVIRTLPSTMRSSSATKWSSSTSMSSLALYSPGSTTNSSLTPKSTSTTIASSSTANYTRGSSYSSKVTSTAEASQTHRQTCGGETASIHLIKIVIPVIGAIILIAAVFGDGYNFLFCVC